MIRKLQIKFITITMFAVIVISSGIFGVIIVENYRTIDRQTDAILNLLAENDGKMPDYNGNNKNSSDYINKETKFSTRYFTVEIDENEEITSTDMKNIARVSYDDVENIIKNIKDTSGYYENFKYRVIEKDNNKMIIFLDCSTQLRGLKHTIQRSILIVVGVWILVLIIVSLLSKRMLKPITENIEKQKQFITNASHELKTPLAVITADIDVLEMTVGEDNEWLESIKSQTNRMNSLIKTLLNLSNVEQGKNKLHKSEFLITDVIKKQIQELKPLLKDKKIEFEEKDIKVNADVDLIKQVISILIDNAIKYTPNDGTIKFDVTKQGKNTKIEISNTCENIENVDVNRVFERFYRDDKSRNKKKDGYGIGLSIAKSIIDVHKGKINAYITDEDMVCFKIVI